MRFLLFTFATLLNSCTSCPRPQVGLGAPRVEDRARGIPEVSFDDARGLLDEQQVRRCQVLFEPAFSNRHAVWIVQLSPEREAEVVVHIRGGSGIDVFSAPLSAGTAARLSRLCLATLTADFSSCKRTGFDGVWYHAAHPAPAGGYVMAAFWTPRRGTVAEAFAAVAEALRDYAVLPPTLRGPAWLRLVTSADTLAKLLPADGAGAP